MRDSLECALALSQNIDIKESTYLAENLRNQVMNMLDEGVTDIDEFEQLLYDNGLEPDYLVDLLGY